MSARVQPLWLGIGFLAAIFLPPAVFVLGGSSSMAAGAGLACVIAVAAHPAALRDLVVRPRAAEVGLAAFLVLLTLHCVVTATFWPFNGVRAAASLGLLALFIAGANAIRAAFFEATPRGVDRICRFTFWLLASLAMLTLAGLMPLVDAERKLILPFAEPSHFALAFAPFFLYASLRRAGWRRVAVLASGLLLGYLVQNLTQMVASVLAMAVCVRGRHLPLFAAALAIVVGTADLTYFTSRLDLSSDSENLSSLVYLQGWQLAFEALERSSYWGIGFQQLGELPTSVSAADLIYRISELELNLTDGGFVLSKLVAEFGIGGALLAALLLAFMGRNFRILRRLATGHEAWEPAPVLARCVVVMYGLDFLVRGAGYFSGTSLLLAASMLYLARVSGRSALAPLRSPTARLRMWPARRFALSGNPAP